MKQDLCKLRYIHTVYVPLQSMTNGFQSEVRVVHAADILFFHFKFMFLTYVMSVRHDISNWVCMLFFVQEKEENMPWVIYKSSITKGK